MNAASHIQRGNSRYIPLYQLLRRLHLGEELRISNNSSGILDLPTSLIQSSDHTNNGALQHVREISDTIEGHSSSPFIDNFNQSEPGPADEIIGVITGENDLMLSLVGIDFL